MDNDQFEALEWAIKIAEAEGWRRDTGCIERIAEARAALTELRAERGWRPIAEAPKEETGWLVEWHWNGTLQYLTLNTILHRPQFGNIDEATRFARKVDAEAAMEWQHSSDKQEQMRKPRDLRVAEHMWRDVLPPPPEGPKP